jgi:hypothetical protein
MNDDYCPKSKSGAHVIDPKTVYKDAQLAADTAREPGWAVSFHCRACEREGTVWLDAAELMTYILGSKGHELFWGAEIDDNGDSVSRDDYGKVIPSRA